MSIETRKRLAWLGVVMVVLMATPLLGHPEVTFGVGGVSIPAWIWLAVSASLQALYLITKQPQRINPTAKVVTSAK